MNKGKLSCSTLIFLDYPLNGGNTWKSKIWNNSPSNFNTLGCWTDGVNIYYSYLTDHYILNGNTWETKVWNGLSSFSGSNIWSDGESIYYSFRSSEQYVLNGDTWEPKTWNGWTTYLDGSYVWTDGVNIYCSFGDDQYVLNGNTWEPKTWNNSPDYFYGSYVWKDGANIYYSDGYAKQYIINGDTWEPKIWNGGTIENPLWLWSDGVNIYYSHPEVGNYVLNHDTLVPKTWNGLTSFYGHKIWTNGVNIYYYDEGEHYVLTTPDPEITSVKVYPAEVTMKPGTDRTFEAVVTGTGTFDSSVDWTVQYGEEYGTPTITQDGQLTIPSDMRPCKVIVIARSVENPDYGGIAIVNVVRDTVYDDVSGPAGGNGSYGAGEGTGYTASGIPLGSNTFDHANTTMATLYALTGPKLNEFGNWLWSTDFDDAITKAQVEFLYGKVSDGVISLVSYPFGITNESTGECLIANESNFARVGNITFYKLESDFSANILQSSDAQIDWGTLNIDEYWGSFLDYSPYTTIELYLPWSSGFVPLNVNEVMGKTLSVKTNIELSTGSCVHNIIAGDECIASYSGQVGVPIPLTSSDLSNKLLKIGATAAIMAAGMSTAGAAVATGVSAAYSHGASYQQRALAGKTPFIPGKANRIINQDIRQANAYGEAIINEAADISIPIASAAARQSTNVTRNGGFSADTASMTIQYPYLVISRPDISVPENYANFYGYPSNITSMLKDLTGYTEVANIHLENVDATADELVLLEKTLKGGVIL